MIKGTIDKINETIENPQECDMLHFRKIDNIIKGKS